jgi:hypothetical protein
MGSPISICAKDNPFRTGEREGFKGGTKVAVVAPAGPAALRIGRKRYGA